MAEGRIPEPLGNGKRMILEAGGQRCGVQERVPTGRDMPARSSVFADRETAPMASFHHGQLAVSKERGTLPDSG
jgi:hypothetical protein